MFRRSKLCLKPNNFVLLWMIVKVPKYQLELDTLAVMSLNTLEVFEVNTLRNRKCAPCLNITACWCRFHNKSWTILTSDFSSKSTQLYVCISRDFFPFIVSCVCSKSLLKLTLIVEFI